MTKRTKLKDVKIADSFHRKLKALAAMEGKSLIKLSKDLGDDDDDLKEMFKGKLKRKKNNDNYFF